MTNSPPVRSLMIEPPRSRVSSTRLLPAEASLLQAGVVIRANDVGAGDRTRTCTPLREEDFKPKRKGRRMNSYLIRRPFPFTRVTRSALQSEDYGHADGHLMEAVVDGSILADRRCLHAILTTPDTATGDTWSHLVRLPRASNDPLLDTCRSHAVVGRICTHRCRHDPRAGRSVRQFRAPSTPPAQATRSSLLRTSTRRL